MDFSKLPRLSESDKHSPPPSPAGSEPDNIPNAGLPIKYGYGREPGIGGQVWLSLVLGLVFMYMGWNFARFAFAKLTGNEFHTGFTWSAGTAKAGQEVAYFDLQGYTAYTDTAIFLFGLSTALEGIVLIAAMGNARSTRSLLVFTIGLTAATTAFNLVVVVLLMRNGITPLMSMLAAAFGAYMTFYEFQMLQSMRARA